MDMDIVTENVSLGEIAATVFVSAALLLIMAGPHPQEKSRAVKSRHSKESDGPRSKSLT